MSSEVKQKKIIDFMRKSKGHSLTSETNENQDLRTSLSETDFRIKSEGEGGTRH